MFIGKFYHRFEEKGRVSLPKAFRDKAAEWIVTRGLDGGLFIFEKSEFQLQLQHIKASSFTKKRNRDFVRLLTNEAYELHPDKNGRVQLPEYLTEFAHLTKDVVIVGSFSYIEVWDRDLYHEYLLTLESEAENLAESMDAE